MDKRARELVLLIADRATRIAKGSGIKLRKIDVVLSMTIAHERAPIKLGDLLLADDINFNHDVFGIMNHVNHETGELRDCFVPRYAVQQ